MRFILNFLVSISVGSLLGDVAFHILPVVYAEHSNASGLHSFVLAGIWVFFVFEKVLQQYHHGHGHGDGHNHGHASDHLSSHSGEIDAENRIVQGLLESSHDSIPESPISTHSSDRHSHIGYLLILSDMLHNLVDGLAIGISFSASLDIGISTSIAVLFHEVPHELGDYVILISSGMPHMKAFLYSLATNATGFIGAVIGVLINEAKGIQPWVLAFTAGNFLYLALSDLIPEMLHDHRDSRKSYVSWISQNVGLVLGASLMFLIKSFE